MRPDRAPSPLPPLRGLAALLAGASLIGLAACASLPSAQAARVAKPAGDYASAKSFALPASGWPSETWWKAYNDPQLDGLIAEALEGSPSLATAEARARKAQAMLGQTRAAGLPSLALNGVVEEMKQSYNNGIPPAFVPQGYNDAARLTLDFNWELDFWGKNRSAVAAATSEARAASADAAEARLMLSTSVATAYSDLTRQYAYRDVAERAVSLRKETSILVQQRLANGLDTGAQARQAEAEPLAAQSELAAVDEQIAQTRNRIAALLGAGPDRGLVIARPRKIEVKPFGLPQTLALDLVGRRPDITAARWRAEAAQSRTKQATAAFYPNVNLTAFFGGQALHLNELFDKGSDVGAVGPAVSLPIFEGGRLRAGLRGAQADRDAAVASYDGAVTEALRQVADAIAGEKSLAVQLADSRAALAASEEGYRLTRLRYTGGLSPYSTVLLSEQTLLTRRRALADLEGRGFALDIALVRALGGGFSSS